MNRPGSTLTYCLEHLLRAECARLRLPPNALVISTDINDNDDGLDAHVEGVPPMAPDGSPARLPAGLVGLQLKATKKKGVSSFDLPVELRKPGPLRILTGGGAYVMVTCQDLNYRGRTRLEEALKNEARCL